MMDEKISPKKYISGDFYFDGISTDNTITDRFVERIITQNKLPAIILLINP